MDEQEKATSPKPLEGDGRENESQNGEPPRPQRPRGGRTRSRQPTQFRSTLDRDLQQTRGTQQGQAAPNPPHHQPQPRRPNFSLAGTCGPAGHAPSYVDPSYCKLNPEYDQPLDKPVWGLAKPLPRVVRKGRGRQPSQLQQAGKQRAPTGTEPIPQVAGVSAQQAEEVENKHGHRDEGVLEFQKNRLGRLRGKSKDNEQDSQTLNRTKSPSHDRPAIAHAGQNTGFGLGSKGSQTSMERYGSPRVERSDPLERYIISRTQSQKDHDFGIRRHQPGRNVSDYGDVGDRAMHRLSDVAEVESQDFASHHSGDTMAWDEDIEAQKEYDDNESEYQGEYEEAFEYGEASGYHNWWSPIRDRFREPLAEGLATFVAMIISLSTNLSILTSKSTAGDYQSQNWAGGLGIMIGVYIAGGISGGHLNPAISIILCVFRGFPPRKTIIYITAQIIGAFLAALCAFGIYQNAIMLLDNGLLSVGSENSGHAFITGLSAWTSPAEGWANEFIATGILACAILALGDDMNAPPGAGMHAFVVGLVVTVLGMAFGYPTGPCLNPARDLGPRLAALVLGYGGETFTMDYAWWVWGAWGSTIGGALVGSFFYDAFIFVGGESPVNYLGRKRPQQRKQYMLRNWWRSGSSRSKMRTT